MILAETGPTVPRAGAPMVRQQPGGVFSIGGMLGRPFDDGIFAKMYHFHMVEHLTGVGKDEPGILLSLRSS